VQALQRAVSGNVELQRERVNILQADAALLTARGLFDFQLTSTLSFSRATTPPLTAEDIASGYTNDLGLDVGVNRQLETGGQLRFSLQNDAFNTNSRIQCGTIAGPNNAACTFYNSVLGLTFTHPLLRGLGAEVTQATIRRQRIQKDISLLNRQMRASNVLRDVVTGYWELAYAAQDLAIRRSAVELAREQLRITKAQIDVGRLAPVDAAAVERAIGDRLQDVATSEQNLYFRGLDLRRLFGLRSDAAAPALTAVEVPAATPHEVDAAAEVQRALDMNPQLRALRIGLQLNSIDLQTAADTLKPRLDFIGTVGSRGRKNDFLTTLSQTFGLDDMTWSAALNFQMPVENRIARGQMQSAQLAAEGTRLDSSVLELGIRDTVLRLSSQIATASKRLDLAKQTVGFAQQNLDAEKARFQVGRSTNNDVLLRQQELKNAEIQVIRATVDLLNADVQLSAITAELLDRYNVVLKGT
jgi:outer membrane protein TolC